MTSIKFFKRNDQFVGLECSGHTGYAEYDKDILCASLSGIIQSGILGFDKVLGIKGIMSRRDKDGYIKVELPHVLDQEKIDKAQILLETLLVSVQDLQEGYSSYISMEVIENVY